MKKLKSKKIVILALALLFLISIGISYAYWRYAVMQTKENNLTSSCLSISLTEESDAINLEKAYPITDEEGMDLTPYTFTIKNTCNSFISYEVALGILEESDLSSSYIAAVLNTNEIKKLNEYPEVEIEGYKEGRLLQTGSLSYEDEETYSLRIWMDESVTMDDIESMNKALYSKIVVTATVKKYSPVEEGFTTLADAMLVNEYQSTSLESAKEKISKKQEPDFTKTAPIMEWQEDHSQTTTTITSTMPHPDLVGQGGIYSQLTNENVLPMIGTGYTFDSVTGTYTLTNPQNVDPTTLDYSQQDYYYCRSFFITGLTDLISLLHDDSCINLYKITSATKQENSILGTGGTKIKTYIYTMSAYNYNQNELESDKSDKGLYIMTDDYGTSYYYRGNVNNNYVLFGGYYWRIIRLNGNESVRLLYAGTSSTSSGNDLNMELTDEELGYINQRFSMFNKLKENPGYVGYMYGNTFNSSYAETHANQNDSEIKKYLDSWYKQNIEDKGLSEYIADAGFCNDRSISASENSGNGYDENQSTYFAGYQRYYETQVPILTCPNVSNDLFTLNGNSIGNHNLSYPIGLMTVDELMLAGYSNGLLNKLSYAYSDFAFRSMSPKLYYSVNASAHNFICINGMVDNDYVTGKEGVRGVINLKGNVEISGGIGTKNDPFVVKTV